MVVVTSGPSLPRKLAGDVGGDILDLEPLYRILLIHGDQGVPTCDGIECVHAWKVGVVVEGLAYGKAETLCSFETPSQVNRNYNPELLVNIALGSLTTRFALICALSAGFVGCLSSAACIFSCHF